MAQIQLRELRGAARLRRKAEKYGDPQLYRLAARAFDKLGYKAAADRCYDRAEYYEKQYERVRPDEVYWV